MAKGLAALTVAEDEPGEGSTLDVFDPSNPFKPPKDIIANSDESTDAGDPATGHHRTPAAPTLRAARRRARTRAPAPAGTTPTPVETRPRSSTAT